MKPSRILAAILCAGFLFVAGCVSTASKDGGAIPYPSDDCIVTGNELGSMGDPIAMVHEGQEVKFCCAPCIKKFTNNPDKYMKNIQ